MAEALGQGGHFGGDFPGAGALGLGQRAIAAVGRARLELAQLVPEEVVLLEQRGQLRVAQV